MAMLIPMEIIQAIPQIQGYAHVEEVYLDLVRRARHIDQVDGGN